MQETFFKKNQAFLKNCDFFGTVYLVEIEIFFGKNIVNKTKRQLKEYNEAKNRTKKAKSIIRLMNSHIHIK